ncbi:type II secretion system F family protein [[Eubacterium] cellulosolvens]
MPNVKATTSSQQAGAVQKQEEEEIIIACPRCGSEIIDMSRGPDVGRCIRCKHIFEIETEESRRRKGKEAPHRIRRKSRFSTLFKKTHEVVEVEGEEGEEEGKELRVRTKEEKTKITVIGVSVTLMIIFFILAALNGIPVVEKVDENGDVVKDEEGNVVKEPLLPAMVLMKKEKEVELQSVDRTHTEEFKVQLDWLAFIMIGLLAGFGPIGIYEGRRNTRIVKLEERLADFLRDLAEASRSGQTLHEAIITASGGEYGELLPEIKKMARQISWGVSATEALNKFSERVKTPLVKRAVTLINEASSAGGDVSRVLEAAANDTKEIQMLQRERKIQMSLYVAVIFVSFVVFLVVILIVYATFVPQMKQMALDQQASEESEEEESETEAAVGGGSVAAFSPTDVDFDEIKIIFIAAALVHAIGDGLVAGLMGSGRMTDGLKLSFAMVLIVFMIFILLMPAAAIG